MFLKIVGATSVHKLGYMRMHTLLFVAMQLTTQYIKYDCTTGVGTSTIGEAK